MADPKSEGARARRQLEIVRAQQQHRWVELVALLEAEAVESRDAAEQAVMLRRIADVYEDKFADLSAAAYHRARAERLHVARRDEQHPALRVDAHRYCVYKVRTKCPECGNPVILDGPLRSVECGSCFQALAIPADPHWKSVLGQAYEDYASLDWDQAFNLSTSAGGLTLTVQAGRQMPRCPACREHLSLDAISEDSDGPIFCGRCGKRSSSHRAPAWLRELLPAERLYCAATEEDPDGAQELVLPGANQPVLMACMGCGAPLSITVQSPRITACTYCHAENFLPDPLWRRLHPVKIRVAWYVRYRN